jgi:ribosome maturation protein SDO1
MPVSIEKAVVARLHQKGQKFEILVDPDKALQFRKGVNLDLNEVLAIPSIFYDVRNTNRVSEEDLQKFFGTTDILKIAEKIIKNGELNLTTEQRRAMIEQKKNQIASIISKRGINPQNNLPHPPQRIINAMEQCGVNVDPFLDAELQVENVVKEIRKVLPITFQKLTVEIRIPAQFAGKVYNAIKSSGEIIKENWLNDGSLEVNLRILAGMQAEFFSKISNLTHGQFESKIISRENV